MWRNRRKRADRGSEDLLSTVALSIRNLKKVKLEKLVGVVNVKIQKYNVEAPGKTP